MVSYLSLLKVADNSGARVVQCIKILKGSFQKVAHMGDVLVVVIKRADPLKRKKVSVGGIYRGLLVRGTIPFSRSVGVWVRFNKNAVVLVNKRNAPLAKRLKGPMLREVCMKYNFLGTITRFVV